MAIVATLVAPTLSDEAANQLHAATAHAAALEAGLTLNTLAIVLLVPGMVWLAWQTGPRSPRLALIGAVLGIAGGFVVVFENGVAAAAPSVAGVMGDSSQAVAVVERIHSSSAVSALEPLSLVGDIGLALLAVAATRCGLPAWAAVAVAVGAFAEGAGFGTGTRALALAGFVGLLVGFVAAVRTLSVPRDGLARQAAMRMQAG